MLQGSTVKTDEWRAYGTLSDEGFNHLRVNHSLSFVSAEGIHTQLIESLWSQTKSFLKIKRGMTKQHLQGVLDMYFFLMDARYRGLTPIEFFIQLIQVNEYY